MNIYVASSWRNSYQPDVVKLLRELGHVVYDFREPSPGVKGFGWSEIDPDWKHWSPATYVKCLRHPVAQKAFDKDFGAMLEADACVLVYPCGPSAHMEAGYFVGAGKPLHVYIPEIREAELMVKMATTILSTEDELREAFGRGRPAEKWAERTTPEYD